MTKAQEIQEANDSLATITLFIEHIDGQITREIQRELVAEANWCYTALGHISPFQKAKSQIDGLIVAARAAKKGANK